MDAQGSDCHAHFLWQLLRKFDEVDYSLIWELVR
jgi:hypothetical protein